MAFTTIAGLAAGTTAVTAVTVLAAVAEVGMALTLVGGITGNKKLMKIGGAMSLIGGVGGMVAGAASGGASAAAGLGEAATETALSAASSEALGAVGQSAIDGVTDSLITDLGGEALSAGANMAPMLDTPQGIVGQQLEAGTLTKPAAQAAGPAQSAPSVNDVAGAQGPQEPAGAQGPSTPYEDFRASELAEQKVGNPSNSPQSSGNFFSKFTNWAEKNPKLLSGGIQLVGGAMKGASDTAMWNEKMGLERDRFNRGNSVAKFQPRGIIEGARA